MRNYSYSFILLAAVWMFKFFPLFMPTPRLTAAQNWWGDGCEE